MKSKSRSNQSKRARRVAVACPNEKNEENGDVASNKLREIVRVGVGVEVETNNRQMETKCKIRSKGAKGPRDQNNAPRK